MKNFLALFGFGKIKKDEDQLNEILEPSTPHLHEVSESDGDEYIDDALRMKEQPFEGRGEP